ncbi:MAG: alpha/beta hydrolase [Actinomycetota bacterium]|nr:alpha/beta hydrolase [Actinomycetota bacterium]
MRPKDSPAALRAATAVPGLEERFAGVKGVRLRYFVGGGPGASLVLAHGLGGAAANWTALAPLLADRYRLLVPDLPGHGGSSPLPVAPTLEPFAERVGLLAELEGLVPFSIVGHSLGGLVALRLARRRVGAVRGVVLAGAAGISTSGRRARKALAITGFVKPGRLLAPYRRSISRSPELRRLVLYWGAADTDALPPHVAESFLAGPALHADTVAAARALVVDDVRRDLEELTCPCLLLWGADDSQTGLEDAFDYARRLRARLRVIADCGHLLTGERPDVCAHAIDEFLATVDATPGSERR